MIQLSFESFEEMKGFAKKLLVMGDQKEAAPQTDVKVLPQTFAMPTQAIPVIEQPAAPVVNPVQQDPEPQNTVATAPAVQVTAMEYTQEDIARAAMTLMDAGKQQQLQDLLTGYGVVSLPELPKEQYGNFATALRGLGAQI